MASPHEQKIRVNGPVVITANRLSDGAVVHRTAGGDWSEHLDDAELLLTVEAAKAALAAAEADGLRAVGPYVAPVRANGSGVAPGNLREIIRKSGPTFPLPSDASFAKAGERAGERAAA